MHRPMQAGAIYKGRFRGAQMVYAETEYRYQIARNGLLGEYFF